MPATAGEKALLAELNFLANGQAAGSFGPGQALAMLSGFVKLRDRVDELTASCATFGGIDAATRLAALEQETLDLGDAIANVAARAAALEQADIDTGGRLDALEARIAALEPPPPAPLPPSA